MMYCAKCGALLDDSARFCRQCGALTNDARRQAGQPSNATAPYATASRTCSEGKGVALGALGAVSLKSPAAKVAIGCAVAIILGIIVVFGCCGHDLSGTYRSADSDYWVKSITFSKDGTFRAVDFDNDAFSGTYSNTFGTYKIEMGDSAGLATTIGNAWYWLEAEKTSNNTLKVTMHTKTTSYNWDGRTAVFKK